MTTTIDKEAQQYLQGWLGRVTTKPTLEQAFYVGIAYERNRQASQPASAGSSQPASLASQPASQPANAANDTYGDN